MVADSFPVLAVIINELFTRNRHIVLGDQDFENGRFNELKWDFVIYEWVHGLRVASSSRDMIESNLQRN